MLTTIQKPFNWLDYVNHVNRQSQAETGKNWLRVGKGPAHRYTGENCIICDHDDWCMMSGDKAICICMRHPSDQPVNSKSGGWLHKNPFDSALSDYWTQRKEAREAYEELKRTHKKKDAVKIASIEQCHAFYTWMLERFKLKAQDEAFLKSTGVEDLSDYGTLPDFGKYKCIQLDKAWSPGIPGIFYDISESRCFLNGWSFGIFRLVRDHEGKAVGVEVRLSDECKVQQKVNARYRPLSSAGKHLGMKASGGDYGVVRAKEHTTTLLITEGLRKAQVASERLGMDCVAVRGVTQWKKIIQDIPHRFKDVSHVIVAYDADYRVNQQVHRSRESLLEALKELEYLHISTYEWDHQVAKGIDDLLLLGESPTEMVYYVPENVYTLDTIADAMYATIKGILENPDGKIHQFIVTMGAGKTYITVKVLDDALQQGYWFYNGEGLPQKIAILCDNKILMQQLISNFSEKARPSVLKSMLEGRNGNEDSPFYCGQIDLVMAAGSAHQNINKTVCATCPMSEYCPYQKNTRRILKDENLIVMAKAGMLNTSNRAEAFDTIICDESLTNSLVVEKEITREDIAMHRMALNMILANEKTGDFKKEQIENTDFLLSWIETEIEMNLIAEKKLRDKNEPIEPVRRAIPEGFEDVYHKHESLEIDVPDGDNPFSYVKSFIGDLATSSVYFSGDKMLLDVPNHTLINNLKGKTIINLDASASEIKMQVFGDLVVTHRFSVYEHQRIFQVENFKGSARQLEDESVQQRLLESVEFVATSRPDVKTAIITKMSFMPLIEKHAKENGYDHLIQVGYFLRDNRGSNSFENCRQLIVVGDFCRNLGYMKQQHQTLLNMGVQCALEDLIEEDSTSELQQALGRIRASRRKGDEVDVFLFTNRKMSHLYQGIIKIPSLEALRGVSTLDQQAGNQQRAAEAEARVTAVLEWKIQQGFAIGELIVSSIVKEASTSRTVALRVMESMYLDQLLKGADQDSILDQQVMDLIHEIVKEMRLPTMVEKQVIGLNLSSRSASLLRSRLSIDEIIRVMRNDPDLVSHLKTHPPVGKLPSSWLSVIKALEDAGENGSSIMTYKELGEASGVSRQLAKDIHVLLDNMVYAYQTDSVDNPENPVDAELREFASQVTDAWQTGELEAQQVEVLCDAVDEALKTLPNGDEVCSIWDFTDTELKEHTKMAEANGLTMREVITVANLVNLKQFSDQAPISFMRAHYWIESLRESVVWLGEDSQQAHRLLKSIYDYWYERAG